MTLQSLSEQWLEAKEIEREAAERRRAIEDQMRKAMHLTGEEEGSVKQKLNNCVVKANCRINRRIDVEKFLHIANANHIDVTTFTRWKAELVMSAYRDLPAETKAALAPAITAEPGRPTFSVDILE